MREKEGLKKKNQLLVLAHMNYEIKRKLTITTRMIDVE